MMPSGPDSLQPVRAKSSPRSYSYSHQCVFFVCVPAGTSGRAMLYVLARRQNFVIENIFWSFHREFLGLFFQLDQLMIPWTMVSRSLARLYLFYLD